MKVMGQGQGHTTVTKDTCTHAGGLPLTKRQLFEQWLTKCTVTTYILLDLLILKSTESKITVYLSGYRSVNYQETCCSLLLFLCLLKNGAGGIL